MDVAFPCRCITFLLICYVTTAIDPRFLIQPDDQRIVLQYGGSPIYVGLDCLADYDMVTMHVYWFKNGVPISVNYLFHEDVGELVDASRYSISGGSFGKYSLQIMTDDDYVTFDTGQYYCSLLYSSNKTVIEKSRTADINIHTSPLCVVDYGTSLYYGNAEGDVGNVDVLEGDVVELSCWSKYIGTPGEDIMVWSGDDVVENITNIPIIDSDDLLISSIVWYPERENHNMTFTCTHRLPGKPNRTCQAGPFNIMYKPSVNVAQLQMQITNYQITLLCNSTGNPSVHEYVWTWDNEVITKNDNFHFENNHTILAIQGLAVENNGPHYVTCTGINDVGNTTSENSTIQVNITFSQTTTVRPLTTEIVTDYSKSTVMVTNQVVHDAIVAPVHDCRIFILGSIIAAIVSFLLVIIVIILTTCLIKKKRQRKSQRKNVGKYPDSKSNEQSPTEQFLLTGKNTDIYSM
ncbi:uncharacterized protein LOC144359215 [Saccoglossus kowalevskii]